MNSSVKYHPPNYGIGSDMPSPDLHLLKKVADFTGNYVNGIYLQTGRQALYSLVKHLNAHGYNRVYLPGFLCESMIIPFQIQGWQLKFYRCNKFGQIDKQVFPTILQTSDEFTVFLSAAYFGSSLRPQQASLIKELRRSGTFVIADETHHPFSSHKQEFDARFASLRKLLPVADGAYLQTQAPLDHLFTQLQESDVPSQRWAAMDNKKAGLYSNGGEAYSAFLEANTSLEAELSPRKISTRSFEVVQSLDYEFIWEARKKNYAALSSSLGQASTLLEPVEGVPAFAVLNVDNPATLQSHLVEAGIFCPIHWPKPQQLQPESSWPDTFLSIPIDHRYTEEDMQYVAKQILQGLNR